MLEFMADFREVAGYPPTLVEITDEVCATTTSATEAKVRARYYFLRDCGYVKGEKFKSRTVLPTHDGMSRVRMWRERNGN
jgi:hypothetical protein